MTKAQRALERDTTPPRIAEGTPSMFPGSDYSFVLQGVFEIQKTLGRVEKSIESLEEREKEQDEILRSVRDDIRSAKIIAGVVAALAAIGFAVLKIAVPLIIAHRL